MAKIGIMPGHIHKQGQKGSSIGVVQPLGHADVRGGLATHEPRARAVDLRRIGGDPVNGTSFLDVLQAFAADPGTDGVVMIGEIGAMRRSRRRRGFR